MPLLDHFSWIAPHYDRVIRLRDSERLRTYVAPGPGHRLLDVGGGTGRVAQGFVGLAADVCILDPSPGMLFEARRKGLCAVRAESERLPFATGTFDRAIIVDAFHHLRHQRLSVRELMRVLAPGGRLVVEEPDIGHVAVKLVALGEKLALMRSRFFQPAAIAAMFRQAGGQPRIERLGHTAWVIVDKAESPEEVTDEDRA